MSKDSKPSAILPATTWAGAVDDEDTKSILTDAESSTASLTASIFEYRTLHGRTYHSDRGETSQYWGANDDRQNESLDLKYGPLSTTLLLNENEKASMIFDM